MLVILVFSSKLLQFDSNLHACRLTSSPESNFIAFAERSDTIVSLQLPATKQDSEFQQ
jgi:hypothetical protein